MRHIPGWLIGASGVGALVGAFYLGSRTEAAGVAEAAGMAPAASIVANAPTDALQVACEPGQRAVVASAAMLGTARVACVSDARPVAAEYAPADLAAAAPAAAGVLTVADTSPRPSARPAVITQPVEVYRPRPRAASSSEVAKPKRTWERSAVIIGSSAAVGATVGGLAKGKKGALIGGIVGGGAATVWDQVTRRRGDDPR
jgi:hypothetical protein